MRPCGATRSGVSIPKTHALCAGMNDGCALAGRRGRAHRHRPYQPPSNPSTTQPSSFLSVGRASSGNHFLFLSIGGASSGNLFLFLSVGGASSGDLFRFCPSAEPLPATFSCFSPSAEPLPATFSCFSPSAEPLPATFSSFSPSAEPLPAIISCFSPPAEPLPPTFAHETRKVAPFMNGLQLFFVILQPIVSITRKR